ncbi:hypothetical protein L7F22_014572 [Adiantum nelumboides]|nr:hypothetical protein [Adiantum nelumboides]
MDMLCMINRDVPCMGVVYESIDQMPEQIKEVLKEEVDGTSMYEEISLLAQYQLEMLHSPLHATTFVLNPQLLSKKPHKDKDVMKGWRMTLGRVGKFAVEKTEFKAELSQYIGLQGDFAKVSALEDMQKLSPVAWWEMHSQVNATGRHMASYVHSNEIDLAIRRQMTWFMCIAILGSYHGKSPLISYASRPCKAWDVLEDDSFEECFEDVNLDDDIAPM